MTDMEPDQVDWGDGHTDTAAAEVAAATEATVTPQAAVAAGDGPMNSNEHPTERGTTSVAGGEETPPALLPWRGGWRAPATAGPKISEAAQDETPVEPALPFPGFGSAILNLSLIHI